MARAPAPTRRTTAQKPASGGGLGGMLRGSVGSVVGATGLNLPVRTIERLTAAVEKMLALSTRVTKQLDRLNATVDILADLRDDTGAILKRMDAMETDLREVRTLIAERLDGVPSGAAGQSDRHSPGATTAVRRRASKTAPR